MFSVVEIYDIAIRLEQNGENVYRKAIAEIPHPDLVPLLEWIIQEEMDHRQWFVELKARLDESGSNPFAELPEGDLVQQFIGEQSFSLAEIDFSRLGDRKKLIKTFVEFEEDTILFYEMLTPFIRDEQTKKQLEQVIIEEKGHIVQLQKLLP
jgi:rubrerythrin